MNYIIFDLEWNNAYNYAAKKGVNEIVEIGAVKLDRHLNTADTFRLLVRPKLSRRLSTHFKDLTHLTLEELRRDGVAFDTAVQDFRRWAGDPEDNVFLSWSTSDLYVLAENFRRNFGSPDIPFMKNYADVQKYCQSFLDLPDGDKNQIGLTDCADALGLQYNDSLHHHALFDCKLSAMCFCRVFDQKRFAPFVHRCEQDYFARLLFKDYFISRPVVPGFNVYRLEQTCPSCGTVLQRLRRFEYVNSSFKTSAVCPHCDKIFWVNVRAKMTFDGVKTSSRVYPMGRKRAKKVRENMAKS